MGSTQSSSASKSSSTNPQKQPMPECIKNYPRLQELEPKQEIALFGQYLPRRSSNDEVAPKPTDDFYFMTCKVETTNKAKAREEFDALLNCQAACSDRKISQKSLPNNFKVWMMKEYNQRYHVKKPEEKDVEKFLKDIQTQGGVVGQMWFDDDNTTIPAKMPEKLISNGFQVGPFADDKIYIKEHHEQDNVEHNMKVKTVTGWGLYESRDFSMYSALVSHFGSLRAFGEFNDALPSFQKFVKK